MRGACHVTRANRLLANAELRQCEHTLRQTEEEQARVVEVLRRPTPPHCCAVGTIRSCRDAELRPRLRRRQAAIGIQVSSLVLTAQQATARLADLRTRNGKLTAEAVVHIAECQRLSQEFERVQSFILPARYRGGQQYPGWRRRFRRTTLQKLFSQVVVVVSHQSPCHRSRAGERHSFKPQSDVEQVRRQWSSHRQGAAGAVCCLAPTI